MFVRHKQHIILFLGNVLIYCPKAKRDLQRLYRRLRRKWLLISDLLKGVVNNILTTYNFNEGRSGNASHVMSLFFWVCEFVLIGIYWRIDLMVCYCFSTCFQVADNHLRFPKPICGVRLHPLELINKNNNQVMELFIFGMHRLICMFTHSCCCCDPPTDLIESN